MFFNPLFSTRAFLRYSCVFPLFLRFPPKFQTGLIKEGKSADDEISQRRCCSAVPLPGHCTGDGKGRGESYAETEDINRVWSG